MVRPVGTAGRRFLLLGIFLLVVMGAIASVASAHATRRSAAAAPAAAGDPFGLASSPVNMLTQLTGRRAASPAGVVRRLTTHISGQTFTTNQEWTTSGSPYVIDGNLVVASGVTLTVDPGVIVKFNGTPRLLTINGTLSAIGTSGSRITFTSYQDDTAGGDTNGDGSATSGAKGQWGSINTGAGAHVSISYADIRYGGSAYANGLVDIYGSGSQATLDNDTLAQSGIADLWVNNSASVTVTNSTISAATTRGIGVNLAVVTVANSTIANNYDGLWFQLDANHPGSSITNTVIQNNSHDGVYLPFDSSTTSDKLPLFARDDITGNTTYAMETSSTIKNRKLIARLIYLGTDPYYWFNLGGCSTLGTPYAIGKVGFRSSNLTIPAGPLSGGTYNVFPNSNTQINCAYDGIDLRGALASSSVASGSPYAPQAQTYSDCSWGTADYAAEVFAANPTACMNDPVNTATGNFMQQVTDASLPGVGISIRFTRYYNSLDTETGGPLGIGWSDNYNARLEIQANGDVLAVTPMGQQLYYTKQSSGSYVGDPGVYASLSKSGSTYTLVSKDQTTLTFDSSGKLTSMVDRNGKGLSFAYNGSGRLSTVTDASSRQMTLAYNASNQLTSITLPGSRTVSYTYVASGSSNSGQLATVTDLRGKVWTYAYTSNNFLQKLTDPLSHVVFTNTYDKDGRVLTQNDALSHQTSFSWNATTQTETVTDPRSHTWTDVYSGNVLQSRTDALNNTTTFAADSNLDSTGVTGPNGKTITLGYDSAGNVTSVSSTDLNATKTLVYNTKNDLTSVTDARGKVTSYGYDTDGNLTSVTQDGTVVGSYAYGTNGFEATGTDANGHATSYTYDSNGNLTQTTDPMSKTTSYTYDSAGRLLTATDSLSHTTSYTYNALGQILSETDPLNHTSTRAYDDAGNLTTVTDPSNHTTTYAYDADNRLSSLTDPLNHTTTFAYDTVGNQTGQTDANNHTTTLGYDADNRLTSVTDALNHTTAFGYDSSGNQTSLTDPLNHTTTYVYDVAGRELSTTNPLNETTTFTYDKNGNQSSITDPNGHTTSYAYDGANRVHTETDALGGVTTYTYDPSGQLTSVEDPRTDSTTYAYNADGRLSSVTDALGNETSYTYDDAGQELSLTDPLSHTTSYSYNAAGQVTSVTDPLNHTTTFGYDARGNKVSVTDANSHETDYAYNAANQVTSVTDPLNNTTSYTYDAVGNLTGRIDPNNHTTTYSYDAANRLTSATSPLNKTWGTTYDAAGNINTLTLPSGNTITYSYDSADRLGGVDYSDSTPDVSYSYDSVGNLAQMIDGVGTEAYTYNADNELLSASRGTGDAFSYAYDATGNITSRTYPDGTIATYGYDADNHLTSLSSNSQTTSYAYDGNGNLASAALPDGVTQTRTYDAAQRVTDVANTLSGGTVSELAYTLDAVGNPTRIVRTGTLAGTQTYAYDADNRVTSVCYQSSCPGGSDPFIRYTYDGVGNRLSEARPTGTTSYTYNAGDQLTAAGSTGYSYDADGNLVSAGANSYSFNAAGELTAATVSGTTTSFSYTGDGNLSQASDGTSTTNYRWDSNNSVPTLATETDGNGGLIRRYLYGLGSVSMAEAGANYYYLTDPLGSVTDVMDSSGNSEWAYTYEPFGTIRTAEKVDPSAPANVLTFTGELLAPSGLYDLRARNYDSTTGRFLSPDPAAAPPNQAYVGSYAYADDRPTSLVDPSGAGAIAPDATETTSADQSTSAAPVIPSTDNARYLQAVGCDLPAGSINCGWDHFLYAPWNNRESWVRAIDSNPSYLIKNWFDVFTGILSYFQESKIWSKSWRMRDSDAEVLWDVEGGLRDHLGLPAANGIGHDSRWQTFFDVLAPQGGRQSGPDSELKHLWGIAEQNAVNGASINSEVYDRDATGHYINGAAALEDKRYWVFRVVSDTYRRALINGGGVMCGGLGCLPFFSRSNPDPRKDATWVKGASEDLESCMLTFPCDKILGL